MVIQVFGFLIIVIIVLYMDSVLSIAKVRFERDSFSLLHLQQLEQKSLKF